MQSTLVKATKIGLAVAALMAAQSASAATFDVYVSGASALRDSMPRILNRFCQANSTATPRTIHRVGTDNDRRAFTCTMLTATGTGFATERAELAASGLDGDTVTVYHSVEPGNSLDNAVGGSVTGIIPLLAGSPTLLNFVNKAATSTNAGTDTTFAGATIFNVTGANAQLPNNPHIGISDVEPKMYDPANTFGNLPVDAAAVAAGWVIPAGQDPANLVNAVAFQGGFGVAVSKNLLNAGFTNISQEQLAAVLSGEVGNWNQIGGPNLPVKVCRRSPGSGTQATFNALVSRKGCGANVGAAEFAVADASYGAYIQENATTGQVRTCLDDANTAGVEGAIGILGLENNGVQAGHQIIDFNGVKIWATTGDTVDGTVDNVREDKIIDGTYALVVDSTVQKSAKIALSTEQNNFYNLIAQQAGNTNITKALPGVVSEPAKRTAFAGAALLSGGASNFSHGGDTCAPNRFQP